MPDVRLTEERLRTYLNTNQPSRERMCLALLGLDPRFSDLHPLRPLGGPDGGKDIEGVWNNRLFYAGIGFRNNACDSTEDRKWAIKKCKSDLKSAKKNKPELDQFIFLTNVDFTPSDKEAVLQYAYSMNYQNVEIFYRERLRVLLDNNPAGYPIRLQYLDIPMSEEEQLSFFNQFGNEIQEVIKNKFENIEKRLNRVEFLADCNKKLNCLYLILSLNGEYSQQELDNDFFLIEIVDLRIRENDGNPGLIVALQVNKGGVWCDSGVEYSLIQIKNYAFLKPSKEKIVESARIGNVNNYKSEMIMDGPTFSITSPVTSVFQLDSLAKIFNKGHISTISDLENCFIYFRASNSIIKKINTVTLIADEYVIFTVPINQCRIQSNPNVNELPEVLVCNTKIDTFSMISHPLLSRLSFSQYTPQKI